MLEILWGLRFWVFSTTQFSPMGTLQQVKNQNKICPVSLWLVLWFTCWFLYLSFSSVVEHRMRQIKAFLLQTQQQIQSLCWIRTPSWRLTAQHSRPKHQVKINHHTIPRMDKQHFSLRNHLQICTLNFHSNKDPSNKLWRDSTFSFFLSSLYWWR